MIQGARNTGEGIAAQKAWIATVRPGTKIAASAVHHEGEKVFEVFELATSRGVQSVCFDITDFFGSW